MHEQSETVEIDGKYYNVYGPGTAMAGKVLPGEPAYDNLNEAVSGAERRSRSYSNAAPSLPLTGPGYPPGYETQPVDPRLAQMLRELILKRMLGGGLDPRSSVNPIPVPGTYTDRPTGPGGMFVRG